MPHARIDDYYIERFHLLTRNEIIVYCYLRKKLNAKTGKCNPMQKTIAKGTNLSAPRVSESLRGLEEKCWAICDENGNFILPDKVTESVRKVTQFVSPKLRNSEVEVTQFVRKVTESVSESSEIRKSLNKDLNKQGTDNKQTSEQRGIVAENENRIVAIAEEVLELSLPPHIQNSILSLEIKDFEKWRRCLINKKISLDESKWKAKVYRQKLVGWALEDYEKEADNGEKYITNAQLEAELAELEAEIANERERSVS